MEECMSNIKEFFFKIRKQYVFNAKASLKPYMSSGKIYYYHYYYLFFYFFGEKASSKITMK